MEAGLGVADLLGDRGDPGVGHGAAVLVDDDAAELAVAELDREVDAGVGGLGGDLLAAGFVL